MFLLREPSIDSIGGFLNRQRSQTFSYLEVGATEHATPSNYTADHNRVMLGYGQDMFSLGRQRIQAWEMFSLGWVRVFQPKVLWIRRRRGG
jgi:uncharacterized protein (UPF0548 family)